MERLIYWNLLGELFELEQAGAKCLELEARADWLLGRLERLGGDPGLEGELRGFLAGLSRELRSVTPRLPVRPVRREVGL